MTWRRSSGIGLGKKRPNLAFVTALSALVSQACGSTSSNPVQGAAGAELAGSGGQSQGSAGTSGSGGAKVIDLGGGPDCATTHLFMDQVVRSSEVGQQRVFYSWTTAEQVAELRAGGDLFSRSERPGMGRGLLFDELAARAESSAGTDGELADILVNQTFAKARFAWTNPWSTLLGFPGESYGDQLLQLVLKPEAWIAYLDEEGLRVYDATNEFVPLQTVLASPERVGAIYHVSNEGARDSPYCGTFSQGSVAFREFALGNLQMIAGWSLATPEISERLQSDLTALRAFESDLACQRAPDQSEWADDVACLWAVPPYGRYSLENYNAALGLPSELYWPSPENIAALIAAVEASLPTGEPLSVTPGE
jgi:hypothetical protein